MCFGGGGSADKIAKQQRADEIARQNRIKAGMKAIDAIFAGTGAGVNAATAYDPTKTYYLADGSVFTPGASTGSGRGGFLGLIDHFGNDPERLIREGKLFTDVQRTGGFGDAFFKKRADDYEAYAMPDVNRQEDQQRKNLVFALARTGNLDSSAAIDKNAELVQEGNKARIGVVNEGLTQANNLRTQVENTRGNLVAELNATGDDSAASASAMRAVANLNQPAGFSPLGNLFLNFADSVARIGSRAGNGYSGLMGGGGASLFSGGGGAQRVVGG